MDNSEKYKIIALFGKSGAGKDTLKKLALSEIPYLNNVTLYTTRPARKNETSSDYYFISEMELQRLKEMGGIITESIFNKWHYVLAKRNLSEDYWNIGVFDIKQIQELKEKLPNAKILPIYVQSTAKTRLMRCLNREEEPNIEEILRRLKADDEDFKNISFDYITYCNDENDWKISLKNFFIGLE